MNAKLDPDIDPDIDGMLEALLAKLSERFPIALLISSPNGTTCKSNIENAALVIWFRRHADFLERDLTAATVHVIYDHPRDFPHGVVVRVQRSALGGVIVPASVAHVFPDIDAARKYCRDLGLSCLGRMTDDDPVIVETWI